LSTFFQAISSNFLNSPISFYLFELPKAQCFAVTHHHSQTVTKIIPQYKEILWLIPFQEGESFHAFPSRINTKLQIHYLFRLVQLRNA